MSQIGRGSEGTNSRAPAPPMYLQNFLFLHVCETNTSGYIWNFGLLATLVSTAVPEEQSYIEAALLMTRPTKSGDLFQGAMAIVMTL